ncbi:hypothetical protein [Mesorhizobium sp. B264B2A]|nr:hypothetical protein [Mesorhizobium sp. B264B2A]
MAQAAHGSAPDIAGKGIVNPYDDRIHPHAAAMAWPQPRRHRRCHREGN